MAGHPQPRIPARTIRPRRCRRPTTQNSGASNLGPTSKALIDRVKRDVEKLKAENNKPIPIDLATASASGLDPDIMPATAAFQTVTCARREGTSFMRPHVAIGEVNDVFQDRLPERRMLEDALSTAQP
jgi:K+-transporting ATPase c subunit